MLPDKHLSLFLIYKFKAEDGIYLLNVNQMISHKIDELTSQIIDQALSPDDYVSLEGLDRLFNLELVDFKRLEEQLLNGIEQNEKKKSKRREINTPITSISINVCQVCNLSCLYCYGDGGQYGKEKFMSKEIAIKSIDWLLERSKNAENILINFFGGEPFLNFYLIKEIVKYSNEKAMEKNKKVQFSLTSNGTIYDDKIAVFIKKNQIKLLISFDGPACYQNANRPYKTGKGSYDDVIANIKKILNNLPHTACRATIVPGMSIFKVREEVKKLGFKNYIFAEAQTSILGNYENSSTDNRVEWGDFIRKESEHLLKLIKHRNWPQKGFLPFIKFLKALILKKKRNYGCLAGKTHFSISVDGDIFPCHRFIGNNHMKMSTIWEADIHRSEYFDWNVNLNIKCGSCWVKYFCGGGCMYTNAVQTGSLHNPGNDFCKEIKEIVKSVIIIFHQLDKSDKEYVKRL